MAWAVEEVRDNKVRSRTEYPEKDGAINHAVDMAEEDGLIRSDEAGDDFAGLHPSWTTAELREQLERDGSYEDGEVKVSIRQV